MTAGLREVRLDVPTAAEMKALGARLAGLLRAGDLVVLTGDLGAGKTTLTQGLGGALGVRGRIASPTFVISRVHLPERDGPGLVHVDAYRLADSAEVADLDLEESLAESVTVIEWGSGLVESLADDRLEIVITRPRGSLDDGAEDGTGAGREPEPDGLGDEPRAVEVCAIGERWADVDLQALRGPA